MDEHFLTPGFLGFQYTDLFEMLQVFGRSLPFCYPGIDNERALTVGLDDGSIHRSLRLCIVFFQGDLGPEEQITHRKTPDLPGCEDLAVVDEDYIVGQIGGIRQVGFLHSKFQRQVIDTIPVVVTDLRNEG